MLLSRTAILLSLYFTFNTAAATDIFHTPTALNKHLASEPVLEQIRPRKRGQSQQTQLPSTWSISANQGGTLCYIDPENVLLWREDATFTNRLSIKAKGSNKPLNLRWATKQDSLKWPHKRIKLMPNNTYYVKLNQRDPASRIIISKQLPKYLWDASMTEQVTWMQKNGCLLQAAYLQHTLKKSNRL